MLWYIKETDRCLSILRVFWAPVTTLSYWADTPRTNATKLYMSYSACHNIIHDFEFLNKVVGVESLEPTITTLESLCNKALQISQTVLKIDWWSCLPMPIAYFLWYPIHQSLFSGPHFCQTFSILVNICTHFFWEETIWACWKEHTLGLHNRNPQSGSLRAHWRNHT